MHFTNWKLSELVAFLRPGAKNDSWKTDGVTFPVTREQHSVLKRNSDIKRKINTQNGTWNTETGSEDGWVCSELPPLGGGTSCEVCNKRSAGRAVSLMAVPPAGGTLSPSLHGTSPSRVDLFLGPKMGGCVFCVCVCLICVSVLCFYECGSLCFLCVFSMCVCFVLIP